MDLRQTKILIGKRFGEFRVAGNEILICCPFCVARGRTVDRNYKLYLNPSKDAAHCWRCEYSGRLSNLIPQLAVFESNFAEVERHPPFTESDTEAFPACVDIVQLPEGSVARTYIEGRGFRVSEVPGRFFYCDDYRKGGSYSFGARLIMPVHQGGVYRGFQARTLADHKVKYINATGMDKGYLLYNYDVAICQDAELIIVEGIFDALKAGPTAVAAFGKSVSPEQVRLIALGNFKKVIILLDNDGTAKKDIDNLARALAPNFNTYVALLPGGHDAGDLSGEEIRRFLLDSNSNVRRIY
jgi:hypothetical protein